MNGGIRNHPLDGLSSYVSDIEGSSLAPESSYSEDDGSSETPTTDDDLGLSVSIWDGHEEDPILLAIRAILERFTPQQRQRIRFDEKRALRAIQTVLEESAEGPAKPWQTKQIVTTLVVTATICAVGYLIVVGPQGASLIVARHYGCRRMAISGAYGMSNLVAAGTYRVLNFAVAGAYGASHRVVSILAPLPDALIITATGAYWVWDLASLGIYGMSRLHRYRAVARICVVQSGILIMAVFWTYEVLHLAGEMAYCGVWPRVVSAVSPLPGILVGAVAAAVNGISQLGQRAGKLFADLNPMRLMRYRFRA